MPLHTWRGKLHDLYATTTYPHGSLRQGRGKFFNSCQDIVACRAIIWSSKLNLVSLRNAGRKPKMATNTNLNLVGSVVHQHILRCETVFINRPKSLKQFSLCDDLPPNDFEIFWIIIPGSTLSGIFFWNIFSGIFFLEYFWQGVSDTPPSTIPGIFSALSLPYHGIILYRFWLIILTYFGM